MKNISYLDMVHELLTDEEFSKFEKFYTQPITKSIKIINHRGLKDINQNEIVYNTLSQERNLSEPEFSYIGKKYSDVLFATRKEKLKLDSLGNHFLHQAGLIYVQEMSAGLSAQVLGVQPGDKVLDMCAAPGGKSIQIADKIGSGFVISNELDSSRLKALESNMHRCGIYNVGLTHQDGRVFGDRLPEFFDKVLVDAPCSGEGIQFKSGKKVWKRDEKKCCNLSDLQTQLVKSGLLALKVGGELVYSTCTTNVLENEIVVANILKKYGDNIELVNVDIDQKSKGICSWRGDELLDEESAMKVARFWPHVQKTGGFFIAKFKKKSSIDIENQNNEKSENKIKKSESYFSEDYIWNQLSKRGIQKDERAGFFESKFTINVAPKVLIGFGVSEIFSEVNIGVPVFKILNDAKNNSKKIVPLVGLSQVFSSIADKNIIDISEEQLNFLMEKQDLRDDRLVKYEGEFVMLRWNGVGVGLVSVQKGVGKNKCF